MGIATQKGGGRASGGSKGEKEKLNAEDSKKEHYWSVHEVVHWGEGHWGGGGTFPDREKGADPCENIRKSFQSNAPKLWGGDVWGKEGGRGDGRQQPARREIGCAQVGGA